jgi:hypothetical protein
MKVFFAAVACAMLLAPAIARGQEAGSKASAGKLSSADPEFSLGQLTPTPEMWFYEQALRRYRDPKVAVRRRAEFEADQRQARLAAQRWFGYSNSRPTVSPVPFTSNYSPMWTSNSPYGNQWRGVSRTTVVIPVPPARSTAGYGLW